MLTGKEILTVKVNAYHCSKEKRKKEEKRNVYLLYLLSD